MRLAFVLLLAATLLGLPGCGAPPHRVGECSSCPVPSSQARHPGRSPSPDADPGGDDQLNPDPARSEQLLVELVNRDRERHHLAPLEDRLRRLRVSHYGVGIAQGKDRKIGPCAIHIVVVMTPQRDPLVSY